MKLMPLKVRLNMNKCDLQKESQEYLFIGLSLLIDDQCVRKHF